MNFGLLLTIVLGVALGIWLGKNPKKFFGLFALILYFILIVLFYAVIVGIIFWGGAFMVDSFGLEIGDLVILLFIGLVCFLFIWVVARRRNMTVADYLELLEKTREQVISIKPKVDYKRFLLWPFLVSILLAILFLPLLWFQK